MGDSLEYGPTEMTDNQEKKDPSREVRAASTERRAALRTLVWAAPAVVATATLRARAAQVTCQGPPGGDGGDGP